MGQIVSVQNGFQTQRFKYFHGFFLQVLVFSGQLTWILTRPRPQALLLINALEILLRCVLLRAPANYTNLVACAPSLTTWRLPEIASVHTY